MIERIRHDVGAVDAYGDATPGTERTEEICGAFTAPRTSADVNEPGRAGVIVGLTLFMPYDFDLRYDDFVDVDGVRYRVDGEPGRWRNPWSGWEPGAEVALVRADG